MKGKRKERTYIQRKIEHKESLRRTNVLSRRGHVISTSCPGHFVYLSTATLPTPLILSCLVTWPHASVTVHYSIHYTYKVSCTCRKYRMHIQIVVQTQTNEVQMDHYNI